MEGGPLRVVGYEGMFDFPLLTQLVSYTGRLVCGNAIGRGIPLRADTNLVISFNFLSIVHCTL
jgi:hypothetical protein